MMLLRAVGSATRMTSPPQQIIALEWAWRFSNQSLSLYYAEIFLQQEGQWIPKKVEVL